MVVPAGPSRDRHEAATWPLRWPWSFFMGPRQTRVEEEVSKALREDRAEMRCSERRRAVAVAIVASRGRRR